MYHWKNFLYCPKLLKSAAEALFKPAHSFLLAFSTIDAGFFIPTVNYFNLEMRLLAYPQGVVKGDSFLNLLRWSGPQVRPGGAAPQEQARRIIKKSVQRLSCFILTYSSYTSGKDALRGVK